MVISFQCLPQARDEGVTRVLCSSLSNLITRSTSLGTETEGKHICFCVATVGLTVLLPGHLAGPGSSLPFAFLEVRQVLLQLLSFSLPVTSYEAYELWEPGFFLQPNIYQHKHLFPRRPHEDW